MAGQSEELLEVLVDLERAKEKERESRFESEALLEGLRAITAAASSDDMFASLLSVLRNAIGFDDAFILTANSDNIFKVVASTDPIFRWTTWAPGAMFRRVIAGSPVALFDVARTPEWERQPLTVKARIKSALHAAFYTPKSVALFVCMSKRPGFFNKQHIHLLQRFLPLASQAMISVEARELSIKQEVLEASRQRLESIIATLPIGLLLFRGDKILSTNRTFHRFVGCVDLETPLSRVLVQLGLPPALVDAILMGEDFAGGECAIGSGSKEARLLNFTLSDTSVSDEHLLVVEDITERKATEEALRYAAFQAGVAETATSILHNIGNAITGIGNRSRRLRDDVSSVVEVASMLDTVTAELLRAGTPELPRLAAILNEASAALRAAVTDDIQGSAAAIGEGVKHIAEIITIQQGAANPQRMATSFCLRRLLEDAVIIQADVLDKYGVRIDIDLDAGLTQVTLPRNQLLQAVVNLIKNSREAIQACSEITRDKRITLAAHAVVGNGFILRVIDRGCGMEPHESANLFRLGYSAKRGGHGYGLHSVANFVQSLNGSISAHSAGAGKGMEICIELSNCVTPAT